MTVRDSSFQDYIAQEVQRCKGVYFPVKTGFILRMLIRKARCDELHPNPDDEFSMPDIGPNYKIISEYQKQFLTAMNYSQPYYEGEPIIVERTHPDGYQIINGHHRWAAALRIGQEKIPVRIVNLTHEADVKKILARSAHTKRIAIDLDEVIFRMEEDEPLERPLPFPWRLMYPERIRLGVPALFHYLAKHGYDIWLYSAKFYSADYIQNCFRQYHVKITGVITAIDKRTHTAGNDGVKLETLISDNYRYTVHIDNDLLVQSRRGSKKYVEYSLRGASVDWSKDVMNAITQIEETDTEGDEQV